MPLYDLRLDDFNDIGKLGHQLLFKLRPCLIIGGGMDFGRGVGGTEGQLITKTRALHLEMIEAIDHTGMQVKDLPVGGKVLQQPVQQDGRQLSVVGGIKDAILPRLGIRFRLAAVIIHPYPGGGVDKDGIFAFGGAQ